MYEMLVGYPPFYSDEPMSTCRKVRHFFLFLTGCLYYTRAQHPENQNVVPIFYDCGTG
jgi:hypothetical protein